MLGKSSILITVTLLCVLICGCAKKEESHASNPAAPVGAKVGIDVAPGVQNPSFENGSLSPWLPFQDVKATVSMAQAHTGPYSLGEAGAGSVYQDVTGLEPGMTYTVSAWVSASNDATATAQIALATMDPGAIVASFSPQLKPDSSSWQLMSHSVRATKCGTIRIQLFRNQGSGVIYWDDVRFYYEK
jgi:carbohydrate binding protein with CBM4/9 domain